MTVHRTSFLERATADQDLARALLMIGAAIVLMLVLTAVFGWHGLGPSYQIGSDPAGPAGLPF